MGIVHFMNVNEGDCIWIKHRSGHNTVIDISNGKRILLAQKSFSENYNQKAHPVNPIEYLKDRNDARISNFQTGDKVCHNYLKFFRIWKLECL